MQSSQLINVDRTMLDRAARLAWRAVGDVEPNPLVGCIIGRVGAGGAVRVLGAGHHRRFGARHAEVEALDECRRRGRDARGATAWVTLEPCAHTGKTGPCADALIAAGVARVVIARADLNPEAAGGAAVLRGAGVAVEFTGASESAMRLTDPFVKRVATGLPWVIAKWAQTMDGRIATRAGESKWISGERSRAAAHRLRARADAVVTGIGTLLADDPLLTARGVRRVRRVATRVVVDPRLETPSGSALARSIGEAPLVICCAEDCEDGAEGRARGAALRERGAEIWALAPGDDGLDLRAALRRLVRERDATNVVVEAGPGLLGRLFAQELVDEAWVFVAPLALMDGEAMAPIGGRIARSLADARRFRLASLRRLDDDALLRYRRSAPVVAGANPP